MEGDPRIESRHASDLRKLGFKPMKRDRYEISGITEEMTKNWFASGAPDGVPEHPQQVKASYAVFGPMTIAIDELGNYWRVVGKFDLSKLEFRDDTERVRQISEALLNNKKMDN